MGREPLALEHRAGQGLGRWTRSLSMALLGAALAGCPDDPAPEGPPLCAYDPPEVPWDDDTRSLRLTRSIVVRAAPHEDAAHLGTIAQDMRVGWKGAVAGPGCDAWVEIEPRGWVCARYLEANTRPPRSLELPRVMGDRVTPGAYASVHGRGARLYETVRDARRKRGPRPRVRLTAALKRPVRAGGRRYWRTDGGVLVAAKHLRVHQPSRFAGVSPGTEGVPRLPLAWVRTGDGSGAPVHDRRGACAEPLVTLPPRTVVPVLEEAGGWARIEGARVDGDGGPDGTGGRFDGGPDGDGRRPGVGLWTERENLRVAEVMPPPAEARPGERWIDVDLAEQVLVAYQGETPVFATLVSTGRPGAGTPEGVFRIWIKFSEKDMRGGTGRNRYHVESVPWTAFFHGDYGLHTAYWHDDFGEPHSSGCVNLAPRDARALYQWTDPWIPDGWTMAHVDEDESGTLVRVRNGGEPGALLTASAPY